MESTSSRIAKAPDGDWLKIWGRKVLVGTLFYLGFWVTGSAVHLYCAGCVSDLTFHLWMLAPLALVLVLAWSAWHRLADLLPQPVPARAMLELCLAGKTFKGGRWTEDRHGGVMDDACVCLDACGWKRF